MNRLVAPLLVVPLLALVPGVAAHAAGSCQGKAATIESPGGPGVIVQGTPGADVILVGPGGASVVAAGGDDTICIAAGTVNAGDGNDSVAVTGGSRGGVTATLGAGDDLFVGGPGSDRVDSDPADDRSGADRITAEWVGTGAAGEPNRDVITGPAEEGIGVVLFALPAGSDLSATNVSHLSVTLDDGAAYVVDGPTSSLTRDGVRVGTFKPATDPDTLNYYDIGAPRTSVTINGTDAVDYVRVLDAGHVGANLGGGKDGFSIDENVTLDATGLDSASVDGGPGRDSFTSMAVDAFEGRLGGQVVLTTRDRSTLPIGLAGMEELHVMGTRITLKGSSASEKLYVSGCRLKVDGGGGADYIGYFNDNDFSPACRKERAVFKGGPGNDSLRATAYRDVLIGGSGSDLANGNGGKDRCVAERKRACEL